nr:integrase, catalytic region, zinc finger, CCHC-type, peptidase aspartic, catalytic [Tanacetum cinerariifolium]
MSTLVEFRILSSDDNRPPMLEKHLYDSWKSIMELYMQNREHGRMILESIEHGPLIWPTIEENGMIRTKKYKELSATEKIQADCDLKATNIILQVLPLDVYSLVNHHRVAKDIWERSPQYGSIHPTQHYSTTYPSTPHAITYPSTPHPNAYSYTLHQDSCPQPQSIPQIEYIVSISNQQTHLVELPQIESGLAVLVFKQGDDLIDAINKMMSFLFTVVTSHPGVAEGPVTQTVITHNATYQADDLDAYDSDCDDFSTAKAVLIANLSSYRSNVLFEVNKGNLIANKSLSAELEKYKERVKLLEERQNVDSSTREKILMDDIIQEKNAQFADFEKKINYLKQTLSEQSKEKQFLIKTFNVFKNKSKEKEAKNIDKEISLEKKVKELDNIVCKMGQFVQIMHMLTKPQVFYDNSLKQALGFQNPFYLKKAQHIRPMIYYGSVISKETNVISIAKIEETLMLEEESRSKMHLKQNPNTDQSASSPIKIKAPQELSKKQFLIENNRLLDQIISQDIVNIVVNSSLDINIFVNVNSSAAMNDYVNYVEMCNKCLELKAELIKQHNMVEKDEYNRLSKSFSKLEQHCIYLELAMQLNKEIFQKNSTSVNQTEPSFDQLCDMNNLKAKLLAKDITIMKLKANINHLIKTSTTNSVKKDIDEIKTINIELKHKVAKLIAENKHLKQTYKQLYDSLKPSRVHAKEHAKSLVVQIVLWYLDSGCSKHMTGDRSQLTNFVHKFRGTVKFSNDQIAKIIGLGSTRDLNCSPQVVSEPFEKLWIRRTSPAKQPYFSMAEEESSQPPQPPIAST